MLLHLEPLLTADGVFDNVESSSGEATTAASTCQPASAPALRRRLRAPRGSARRGPTGPGHDARRARARCRSPPRRPPRRGPSPATRGTIRSVSPTTPTAPTACPPWSKIGAATLDSPRIASSRSRATPRSRMASNCRAQLARAQRPARQLRQRLGRQVVDDRRGGVREDRLAERARVDRQLGADLEDLQRLVGPEDVVHDDHARPVHHADADRGVGALGQPLGVDERAGAQLVEVEVGVAELQQARPRAGTCPSRGPARRSRGPAASAAARGRWAPRARGAGASSVTPRRRGPPASALRMRAARSIDWMPERLLARSFAFGIVE